MRARLILASAHRIQLFRHHSFLCMHMACESCAPPAGPDHCSICPRGGRRSRTPSTSKRILSPPRRHPFRLSRGLLEPRLSCCVLVADHSHSKCPRPLLPLGAPRSVVHLALSPRCLKLSRRESINVYLAHQAHDKSDKTFIRLPIP